jgi:hypothetical protein
MNVIPIRRIATAALFMAAAAVSSLAAQGATPAVVRLVATPSAISVEAGQEVPFKVTAYDAQGLVWGCLSTRCPCGYA